MRVGKMAPATIRIDSPSREQEKRLSLICGAFARLKGLGGQSQGDRWDSKVYLIERRNGRIRARGVAVSAAASIYEREKDRLLFGVRLELGEAVPLPELLGFRKGLLTRAEADCRRAFDRTANALVEDLVRAYPGLGLKDVSGEVSGRLAYDLVMAVPLGGIVIRSNSRSSIPVSR